MKKLSIIIPVYNAMTSGGGYIIRCIESVLAQEEFALTDIEIILINDGSKDNSLDVLQKFQEEFPSIIRLVNQDNMGVANTRNKAMQLATGIYTTFLDQDDWIDKDFCATLYREAEASGADLVVSGYRRPNIDGKITKSFQPARSPYGRYTISAAWAKIHKTSFLRQNKIEFFDNSYGEDLPFMTKENANAKKSLTVQYIGYNWYFNEQSVSNTSQKVLTADTIAAIEKLFIKLCSDIDVGNKRDFQYYLLRTAVFYLLFSGKLAYRKDFMMARQRMFKILRDSDPVFTQKSIHKLLVPPVGESFWVGAVVAVFIVTERLHLMRLLAYVWCRHPKI